MSTDHISPSSTSQQQQRKPKPVAKPPRPPQQSSKLRGLPTDALPIKLSKAVSYLLRHGAAKEGLDGEMRSDGYMPVDVLMSHRSFLPHAASPSSSASAQTEPLLDLPFLTEMVLLDSKSRFSLIFGPAHPSPSEPLLALSLASASTEEEQEGRKEGEGQEQGRWWIRANQGHSIKVEKIEESMRRVDRAEEAGEAVHGTKKELWEIIYEKGLSRMTRQHIHMALSTPPSPSSAPTTASPASTALDPPTDPTPLPSSEPALSPATSPQIPIDLVQSTTQSAEKKAHHPRKPAKKRSDKPAAAISGIRTQSTLYIYLDIPLLLAHGVPLYLSANSVLLSPGDPKTPGVIGREYFLKAVDRKDGRVVWERDSDSGRRKANGDEEKIVDRKEKVENETEAAV